jgi:4-amino-4-deoxychorismate lyase
MCQLIESIKLVDGIFFRLPLHQARVNMAFNDLFPTFRAINLTELLSKQEVPIKGNYKCRIVFDHTPQLIEFVPYTMREVKSLQLVETQIEPKHYKLENRDTLNHAFAMRGNCDDIIMLNNGLLSDAWYSNIALWDGINWCTPTLPIIYGTQRAALLQSAKVIEKDISKEDLCIYSRIRLFNAMIEFGEIELDINSLNY